MNTKQLFKISKTVYHESLLQSQLNMMGSNKERYLERLSNKNDFKTQAIFQKVVIGVYYLILGMFPIQNVNQIKRAISSNTSMSWIVFSSVLTLSVFLILQFILLLTFTLMFSSNLMSGDQFKWLATLPLHKQDVQKIAFLTFFRGIDIQMIGFILALPLAMAISTKNILFTSIGLLISIANAFLYLSLLIILGQKMSRILEHYAVNDRKTNLIRIFSMLAYLLSTLFIFVLINWASQNITKLYNNQFLQQNILSLINPILSIVPFPFALCYVLTFISVGEINLTFSFIGAVTGTILYFILTYFVVRKAIYILGAITLNEIEFYQKDAPTKVQSEDVSIVATSPIRAFIKKDLHMATRDIQTMSLFLFPILFPVLSILGSGGVMISDMTLNLLLISNLPFIALGSLMMVQGVSNMEKSGATINASLPISGRDQIKAKIPYFIIILPLALFIPLLFLINQSNFFTILLYTLLILPLPPLTGLAGLFLKIRLFGKLSHKYVLEDVNDNAKVIKWISITAFNLFLVGVFIFLSTLNWYYVLIGEGALALLIMLLFNLMFPKKK